MEIIRKKIKTVEERIQRLKEVSARIKSFNEYLASQDLKDIVERNLQLAIEGCLDIGRIILSNNNLPEPKDNKGIFQVLAQAGIVSKESLEFLVSMAGTRNILVRGYDRIDDSIIYGIIKRHLDDFERYLAEIKDQFLN